MTERIQQLEQFLKEEPEDPFLRYALATEYKSLDSARARQQYEEVLSLHPDYLPTYYQLAQLYFDLGEEALADSTYQAGIALAEKQGEDFTLRELKNAYQNFLFETDDE